MATKESLVSISLQSAADLSTIGQYRFGTVNASGQIAVSGADARQDGIIQDNPDAADRASQVGIFGVSLLELGGVVTAGDEVKAGANGVGLSGSTNSKTIALTSGVSGEIISVLKS